jgi:hypothetical protein
MAEPSGIDRQTLKPMHVEPVERQSQRRSNFFDHFPLVTTRVGFGFLAVAVCILLCSVTAHALPNEPQLHSLMWIAAIAIC